MSKTHTKTLDDLFELFEPYLTAADVMAAKLQSEVCSAITGERLRRGLTQEQFAELLGVSEDTVSQWESEDCNFTIKQIADIAAKLDLKPIITFANLDE